MGTKYTIEVEDKPFELLSEDGFTSEKLYRVKGFNSLMFDWNGLNKLTPYTEPDMEQVRKKAYEQGHENGFIAGHLKAEKSGQSFYEDGYQRGLNDAWEAARKIWQSDIYLRIFKVPMRMDCFTKFSASEAIEKIRQYEQEKEEINVGDEVIRHYKSEFAEGDDAPSIFLSEEDGYFRCLAFNGRSIMIAEYPKKQYRKTGRHFPEIAEVLQKMKEA